LAADRAVVDEDVLAPLVLRDEAVALVVSEPLHGSGCHVYTSLDCVTNVQRKAEAKTGTRSNSCGHGHSTAESAHSLRGHGLIRPGAARARKPRTRASVPSGRGPPLRRLSAWAVRRLFQPRAPGSSRAGAREPRSSLDRRLCRARLGEVACLRRSSR